ncbi:MAG: glycoside hydrolase family 2 protein [Alphaproteobacteria bacterium]|nr:glycoside hydrolase family 2 protein [Alphaproteobacteria bacterium]
MRSRIDFNSNWLFEGTDKVTLPHTAVELPFAYFDERAYQRKFTYEKRFVADPAWAGREVSLCFDGAMANAKVRLNGTEIAAHADGYTPFEARLTGKLKSGGNIVTVIVDGSENPDIPPFGGVIDYLTYAGIYREVWLKVTAPVAIANVKIETPDALAATRKVTVAVDIANPEAQPLSGKITATLCDPAGMAIASTTAALDSDKALLVLDGLAGIALWDIDTPMLYEMVLSLETEHGSDRTLTRFGFRDIAFTPKGFLLNGRRLKLLGLDRHQSYPYSGYGLGRAAQERDVEILKNELRVNIVRTSHYPQSPWFLDKCDELGLLVLEEIPGWQHIGGARWKAEAVENVKRMITRDWNHPSIVTWGVRINESRDDHDFYAETNAMARSLDTTRPTCGVRNFPESEFLEDVYTMNDFIDGDHKELGGNRPKVPLRTPREVTGLDRDVPYLVTEFGGHTYPTKSYDQEQRQAEHVSRYLGVIDAAYGNDNISGTIGWCAFDYNTHKDFGSGDRICHHGVMDMFREPKFAAYVYKSQSDPERGVVLEPVTFWARGERNVGGVLPLIVLTNCDEIEFRYGDNPPKRFTPDRAAYPNLPHAPVVIDRHHFTEDELGEWGMFWEDGYFAGYVNGEKVAERHFAADPVATALTLVADKESIGESEDVRLVVRALDQAGNKLPFLFEPVAIAIEGPAILFGPDLVPLRGGAAGFWLRSTGTGTITASVTSAALGTTRISIAAERETAS